jgi:hypothetical protein
MPVQDSRQERAERVSESRHPAAEVRELSVRVKVGGITVTTQPGLTEAEVRITRQVYAETAETAKSLADRIEPRVTRQGGKLVIEDVIPDNIAAEMKAATGPRKPHTNLKVEVRLPEGRTLDMATDVGGVTFDGNATDLKAATRVGGITLSGVVRDTLTTSTDVGGVKLQLTEMPAKSLVAQTRVGGVTVRLPQTAKADVEMATRVGGVRSDFPLTKEPRKVGDVSGRMQGKINGGGTSVRLATDVGGVTLSAQ